MEYTRPISELADFFQRFPGIGPKSAQRLAFYLLKMPLSDVEKFAAKMVEAKTTVKCCSKCFNIRCRQKYNRKAICRLYKTRIQLFIIRNNNKS